MTEPLILPLAPGDPQHLGGHQLIGLLGHGGMGRVYLGISPDGGRVAVKVMHPHYAGDSAFRERFKREAETAQRVSGRFTARVLDSGVDERTPWLATEYIPGPTLAQLVSEYGPLPDASVRAPRPGWRRH
jgi:serine/threonine protein kinase